MCTHNDEMILISYVDDLVMQAKDQNIFDNFKRKFSKRLILKYLGRPSQLFRMELNWKKEVTVHVWQTSFIAKLVREHKTESAKTTGSSMCSN